MGGVPGVFWRCPAVLWGPSTHNPALVLRKTHTSKNCPIFRICMWKWAESAPCGQARFWRPNGHQHAKSHAVWQSPLSRTEKLRTFSKKIDLFWGPPGFFLRFSRCWPYFVAGILFDGFGRTKKASSSVGSTENPSSERSVLCGTYGHIHRP